MSRQISEQYCRSVLHVEVPVVVTLATKRMPIDQVLKLVPGVMIQFDKPCDSPMTLELGGIPIAQGEVVKIGDKFGIRISEIARPAERFIDVDKLG
jgi:flagellar motor switch protein FliN/FliY